MNVADAAKYPEFKGNVGFVNSHSLMDSKSSSGSHHGHDALTYMNVGKAMGTRSLCSSRLLDLTAVRPRKMVYRKQSTMIIYSQWISFSNTTMHAFSMLTLSFYVYYATRLRPSSMIPPENFSLC
eukprot:COSAG01_NODE_35_length_34814_cov_128.883624_31_plen_125_part_00